MEYPIYISARMNLSLFLLPSIYMVDVVVMGSISEKEEKEGIESEGGLGI